MGGPPRKSLGPGPPRKSPCGPRKSGGGPLRKSGGGPPPPRGSARNGGPPARGSPRMSPPPMGGGPRGSYILPLSGGPDWALVSRRIASCKGMSDLNSARNPTRSINQYSQHITRTNKEKAHPTGNAQAIVAAVLRACHRAAREGAYHQLCHLACASRASLFRSSHAGYRRRGCA